MHTSTNNRYHVMSSPYNAYILPAGISSSSSPPKSGEYFVMMYMRQSQIENEEHYSISHINFIEITPDFLCPFMND